MFGIGIQELLVILAIVVLLFGARRLPEIGSGLGKAIKNFKSGVSGKDEIDVTPKKEETAEGKPPS
jgi:sec-independent protein translocase protein TatA